MKKRNLLIAAGVVAAGVCIWLIARPSKGPKVLLETAPISHITIRNSVTATGTVEPVTQVEVGTQVSGIIDKLYADYNDQVKAGQLIAEMDKVTLQAELESAQAQLASSKTEYEYQTKNYARTKTLHEKQLVSDAEYDQAFYLYETARNAYEQSQAAMVKVKRNLGYATITSPIDGVVISRAVEEGQTVAAGFETPTLFTIANDLTQMQVVADVDEADIAGVKDSAKVTFTVDAYPDDIFTGKVYQIRLGSTNSSSSSSSTSTTSESVVTYEVVITADNPDLKLKPRLTANVTIYTNVRENVLTVPSKALRFTPEESLIGKRTVTDCDSPHKVWTMDATGFTAHPVETGINDGTNTEIISGLEEGTQVVTETVLKGSLPSAEVSQGESERSPFMPGPPDRNKKNKNKTEE